jgi:hypothetical protein
MHQRRQRLVIFLSITNNKKHWLTMRLQFN